MAIEYFVSLKIWENVKNRYEPDFGWKIINRLRKGNVYAERAFGPDGVSVASTPWNTSETDMKSFSKNYPKMVFCLLIQTPGNLYLKKYFRNGKKQVCKGTISYEPFNVRKLR